MKAKSVSMEDLGNIVKHMINGALADTEQLAKFRRVIYEEWDFKNVESTRDEENNVDPEEDISATIAHRRIRTYKYRRLPEDTEEPLDSEVCPTEDRVDPPDLQSEEISPTSTGSVKEITKSAGENVQNAAELIEIWNNPTQCFKVKKKPDNAVKKECKTVPSKEKLSFEAWAKNKNVLYRQRFKKEQRERQRALRAKTADLARKRNEQEAQARLRQQHENQRSNRISAKYLEMMKQANEEARKKQIEEKRLLNEQAYKQWRKEKDMKLKEERKMLMAGACENSGDRKTQERRGSTRSNCTAEFDSWLNQLDCVLHEKYLRERRYLVRSFYCQPVYYGDATMYG